MKSAKLRSAAFLSGILMLFFTSCLPHSDNGNFQTFSGLIGSIVTVSGSKYFRTDVDGSYIYSTVLEKFQPGDRVLVSVTINYDKQISGASYLIGEFQYSEKIDKKNAVTIDSNAAVNTFANHSILSYNLSYMLRVGSEYIYTTNVYYYGTTTIAHRFDLIQNNTKPSDTLKFELRHNKLTDTESSNYTTKLMSFNITQYLDTLASGKSKNIQISFNLGSKTATENIVYTKP